MYYILPQLIYMLCIIKYINFKLYIFNNIDCFKLLYINIYERLLVGFRLNRIFKIKNTYEAYINYNPI